MGCNADKNKNLALIRDNSSSSSPSHKHRNSKQNKTSNNRNSGVNGAAVDRRVLKTDTCRECSAPILRSARLPRLCRKCDLKKSKVSVLDHCRICGTDIIRDRKKSRMCNVCKRKRDLHNVRKGSEADSSGAVSSRSTSVGSCSFKSAEFPSSSTDYALLSLGCPSHFLTSTVPQMTLFNGESNSSFTAAAAAAMTTAVPVKRLSTTADNSPTASRLARNLHRSATTCPYYSATDKQVCERDDCFSTCEWPVSVNWDMTHTVD